MVDVKVLSLKPSFMIFSSILDVKNSCFSLCSTSLPKGPAAIVRINTSQALAQIGGKVELTCVSDGDPTPNVTWYRPDGSELVTNTAFDNVVFVDINNNDDFGEYRCKADNGLGAPVERLIRVEGMCKGKCLRATPLKLPCLNWLQNSIFNCKPVGERLPIKDLVDGLKKKCAGGNITFLTDFAILFHSSTSSTNKGGKCLLFYFFLLDEVNDFQFSKKGFYHQRSEGFGFRPLPNRF